MTGEDGYGVLEDDLVPISALRHMLYCPRRCALIHVERQWSENSFTAEGRLLHRRADAGGHEHRAGVRVARSVPVWSKTLGISGIADVVEVRERDGSVYPIEYKRGRPRGHRADEVQLCAQALCLEEMLAKSVPEGAFFIGQERRRRAVVFDSELRALTETVAADARRLIGSGHTPPPVYEARKCEACSLKELCMPRAPRDLYAVARWLATAVNS